MQVYVFILFFLYIQKILLIRIIISFISTDAALSNISTHTPEPRVICFLAPKKIAKKTY